MVSRSTTIRPAEEKDLTLLSEMRNDEALQLGLLSRPRPNRLERVRAWLAQSESDPSRILFVVAAAETDEAVGYVQLSDLDQFNRRASLGIAIHPAHRGKGHGAAAIELISQYARRVWSLRKIVLEVRADNEVARSLYERQGFREVGVLEGHFLLGDTWHDVVVMEKRLVEG